MLIGLLSPAVQADESKAKVKLKVKIVSPLSVITGEAKGIGTRQATLNGILTSLGGASSVAVSFGWDTVSHAEDADGYEWTIPSEVKVLTGTFKTRLAGLTRGTTYYFRAKADDDGTIAYGSELSFTTNAGGRWWWLVRFFPWLRVAIYPR